MMLLFLLLLAQPLSADPSPQSSALDSLNALLSGTFADASADVVAWKNAMRRYECVRSFGTRAGAVSIAGELAVVDVIVAAMGSLPITHVAREFPSLWRVELHRTGEGWRLTRVDSVELDLATALAFSDPPAQEAFLRDCGDLVSPELVDRLIELGLIVGSKGQYARQEQLATIAAGLADELRDPISRARALWFLGRAKDTLEAYDAALVDYEEAQTLADEYGDRETAGRALVGRGFTYVNRYEFAKAADPLERGLTIALSVGDHMIADNAYLAMASMHLLSGEYVEALRDFDRARDHAAQADDRAVVAAATANSGLVFNEMNNSDLAADRLRDAIVLYRRLGNVRGEMRNLRNLADIEANAGHGEVAARYLEGVESYLAREPNARQAAFVAATRATLARVRHDFAGADREAARALGLAAKAGNPFLVAVLTNTLSEIRLEQGRARDAADLAEKAVALSMSIPSVHPRAKLNAAKAYLKLARTDEAIHALHDAVDSTESQLANVPGTEEDQQIFYQDKTGPYYEMFRLLVGQHQSEAAIEWIERSRSRSLIEYLGRNKISADRSILSPDERNEESSREQDIVSLNRNLRELYDRPDRDASAVARIESEIQQKRRSLQDYKARLYSRHPELALARGALPRPSLSDIRKLIPDDGAILEYVVGTDAAWLIVIQETGSPFIARIDIDATELGRRVEGLAKQIAERNLGSHASAQALYDLLLRPAELVLRTKKSLCIIPDGPLWQVPFHALAGRDKRYLVEGNTIFYTPSLSLLAWYAKHPVRSTAKANILIVANPMVTGRTVVMAHAVQRDETLGPLPDAEDEARQIRSMYGDDARVVIGANATEGFLKRNAGRYRMIHLATHAAFDDTSPLYSHLVLAAGTDATEDGLLEAREIMNLDLALDLVVLSSCETGRGKVRGGDGLIGMSWALLVAGCPTAVVSQWKVGSAGTAKLMTEFHRRLSRVPADGRRRAAAGALREAQLALMRMPQYQYPYDWSAFMVVGNGW